VRERPTGFQRTQVAVAPVDSTRAARLAMARKILFDMEHLHRVLSSLPTASASGLPEDPLRSMVTPEGAVRARVRLLPTTREGRWGKSVLRLTSPAHCSLCSCHRPIERPGATPTPSIERQGPEL
jgi:hypothetical protein